MTTVERLADLAAEILARPARLGGVRLVAVDGPSGAGKTSFADRLAGACVEAGARVAVVHTDELLDGWDDQVAFWTRLEACVLGPLARGQPGRYPVYDWGSGRFASGREVPVPEVLIIEGATSARPEAYPRLSFSVFVTADREVRRGRVLARDGAEIAAPLARWMDREETFFAEHATAQHVDRVVDGVAAVGHDPGSSYVRLR